MGLRSNFFEELDAYRIGRLGFDPRDSRPEYLAIRNFMEASPRARTAPFAVEFSAEEGGWFVNFEHCGPHDHALAVLALRSVTSAPVFVQTTGDGSGGLARAEEIDTSFVEAEIAQMKHLGMWNAK